MAPARLLDGLDPRAETPLETNYVPAGSLTLSKDECGISDEEWALTSSSSSWTAVDANLDPISRFSDLPISHIQSQLVKPLLSMFPLLRPFANLAKARWIRLEYRIVKLPGFVAIRVWLLPDDVDRRILDRIDPKLRKARQSLLQQLDYSKDGWIGDRGLDGNTRVASPVLYDQEADVAKGTLLELFNNIPSPDPSPEAIPDPEVLDAMYNILDSNVDGLTSTLYHYQRRSAALMLQRESTSEQVVDPRLVQVRDQEGGKWYVDRAAGVVLKEPRFYDGIKGGILAEEMGSGKTIICLSLILATKHLYALAPELYRGGNVPVRKEVGSLLDMAASAITRNSVPWLPIFTAAETHQGLDFQNCVKALERNPGVYFVPPVEPRRSGRRSAMETQQTVALPDTRIYLSKANLVVVPNNLVQQWQEEIKKHTDGLEVLTISRKGRDIPEATELLKYDVIIFAQTTFEALHKNSGIQHTPLAALHFKRCIVDEGHRLGNSKIGAKSNLLLGLECLHFSSRWIVTGTPAQGLFGVEETNGKHSTTNGRSGTPAERSLSGKQESQDLQRLGSITALYLKARPWANTSYEGGDTPADWAVYVLQPEHSSRSSGRRDCLRATVNSLIIRHRLGELSSLLPPVEEKVVVLDGSYQDKLSLNLFSMMIIFNSVQSQRTDQDYLFHPKQKKALNELVHNLREASFFGGSIFTDSDLSKAIATAEEFLEKKNIPISTEDDSLLRKAIEFGHVARDNHLRNVSKLFHEVPLYVSDFPAGAGEAWSIDSKGADLICSHASMLVALQRVLRESLNDAAELNALLNGGLVEEGRRQRSKALGTASGNQPGSATPHRGSAVLAGNTKLGDTVIPGRSRTLMTPTKHKEKTTGALSDLDGEREIPQALAKTKVVSTASAKLSYLIDSIVKYQGEEQIIIFYDNENVAWHLAGMLDMVR